MFHSIFDRVEVRSQYYPEQSNPLKDQYIFVYKVKITNQSPQTVQLVSRTWEIKAIEATEVCQPIDQIAVVSPQNMTRRLCTVFGVPIREIFKENQSSARYCVELFMTQDSVKRRIIHTPRRCSRI